MHEIAEERARLTGRDVDEELRASQKEHYERRVMFERSFEEGERFLYGALNIGGVGLPHYGQFCVMLGDKPTGVSQSAYLPENSAERYVHNSPELTLDEAGLRNDISSPSQRHCLAGLKHAEDVAQTAETGWAAMLCSDTCFVESIFVGEVSPVDVTAIRITKNEMKRLSALLFKDLKKDLHSADRQELNDFAWILEKLNEMDLVERLVEV